MPINESSGSSRRPTYAWLFFFAVGVVALRRYRAWRLSAVGLLPNRLVQARGLTRRNAQKAADPRHVGVW